MEKTEGQLNTKAVPKFVQIITGSLHYYHHLYALDEEGVVWIYDKEGFMWERMTSKREEA